MKQIDKLLQHLGEPYGIQDFDSKACIHRKFGDFEFEVSGTAFKTCTLYVWTDSPKEVIAIYKNIPTEHLKDVLGYYACIYQNLPEKIQIERQEIGV